MEIGPETALNYREEPTLIKLIIKKDLIKLLGSCVSARVEWVSVH